MTTRLIRFVSVALACVPAMVLARQQAARDTAARPTGTATVTGTVVTDEANPHPLRKVTVTLAGGALALPLSVVTDDNGQFQFVNVAAGSYSLLGNRPGFVTTYYGGKRPGRPPGVPVAVGEGEHLTGITLKQLHGGVIAGTVRDQVGQPLPNLSIQVTEVQNVNGKRASTPGFLSATTDDRGEYRQFGLAPGQYIVMARPGTLGGFGPSQEARQTTTDDIRWAQQVTGANSAPAGAAASPGMPAPSSMPPSPPAGQTVTYTSVYYPGTADPSAATVITLGPNEERAGVDFSTALVPTAKVSGTVVDPDGLPPQSGQVSLISSQSDSSDFISAILGQLGQLTNGRSVVDGKFSVAGVTPGHYRLMIRGAAKQPGEAAAPANPMSQLAGLLGGGRAGGASGPGNLWAAQEIEVDGHEISGLALRLQPGMNVSGKVVYESAKGTPVPAMASARVMLLPPAGSASPLDMVTSMMGATNANVAADGTFVVKGVVPDKYRVMVIGPGMLGALAAMAGGPALPGGAAGAWTLKSVIFNGRDVADLSFDVKPGEDASGLVATFTDQPIELSGRIVDKAGRPAPGFPIVVFSADTAYWTVGSRRVQQVRPSSDGKYSVSGLPAGDYFVCAVTDIDPNDLADPSFLQQLVASNPLKLTLHDGDKKVQDLRLPGA